MEKESYTPGHTTNATDFMSKRSLASHGAFFDEHLRGLRVLDVVRFLAPGPGARPEDHDTRTDEVIARINRSGEAMFGGVTWKGRRAMRISVVCWRTTPADVDRTMAAVAGALAEDAQEGMSR